MTVLEGLGCFFLNKNPLLCRWRSIYDLLQKKKMQMKKDVLTYPIFKTLP